MTRPKPESQRAGRPSTAPRTLTGGLDPDLDAPRSLGEVGTRVWRKVLGLGLPLAEGDLFALTRLCELHDRRAELQDAIKSTGVMTIGSTGQPVANPALRAIDSVEGRMAALEATLLLTPDARARYGLGDVEVDELEEFLNDRIELR